MGSIACTVSNVTKIYQKMSNKANDAISFEIHEGEIFGLLGPNGAGKTTLVHQIAGLIRPTSGSIFLFKRDVVKRPEQSARLMALQPQYSMVLRHLFPEEGLYYTGLLRGLKRPEALRQCASLLDEFDLNEVRRKRVSLLSGGQRKLFTIAVTLIGNRPLLIFDEPTNDLDPAHRRLVWNRLLQQQKQGSTILLVTHQILEAERVIQRVGIMQQGRLTALGTPGDLKIHLSRPMHIELFLKRELDMTAMLPATLKNVEKRSHFHWALSCSREELPQTLNQLFATIDAEELDDLRISSASLEDIYLKLGNGPVEEPAFEGEEVASRE